MSKSGSSSNNIGHVRLTDAAGVAQHSLWSGSRTGGGFASANASVISTGSMAQSQSQKLDGPKGKGCKGQWLSRVKGWVSTSEPSTQALRQHKKLVYEKAGVSRNDPQASAKLQCVQVEAYYLSNSSPWSRLRTLNILTLPLDLSVSANTIPDEAIRPAAGPDPDEVARKRAEERRSKRKARSDVLSSSGSQSARSHSMSLSPTSSRQAAQSRPPFFPV